MDDKKEETPKETKEEPKTNNSDKTSEDANAGTKEKPSMIDGAILAAEELKKATAAAKIENDRAEAIASKKILGGTTQAGQTLETQEESDKDYAKRVMEGKI